MKLPLQATSIFPTSLINLTGWLEAFSMPDKSADTIVSTFINHYLSVHMCPRYILSDNGTELKKTTNGSSSPTTQH